MTDEFVTTHLQSADVPPGAGEDEHVGLRSMHAASSGQAAARETS